MAIEISVPGQKDPSPWTKNSPPQGHVLKEFFEVKDRSRLAVALAEGQLTYQHLLIPEGHYHVPRGKVAYIILMHEDDLLFWELPLWSYPRSTRREKKVATKAALKSTTPPVRKVA